MQQIQWGCLGKVKCMHSGALACSPSREEVNSRVRLPWSTRRLFENRILSPAWTQHSGEFQSVPPQEDITTQNLVSCQSLLSLWQRTLSSFPRLPALRDKAHDTSKVFSLVLEGWSEEDGRRSSGCLGFLSASSVSKVKEEIPCDPAYDIWELTWTGRLT